MSTQPIITKQAIDLRVSAIADLLQGEFPAGTILHVVVVLAGAAIFAADLVRKLPKLDVRMHFITAASYGGSTRSSGAVKMSAVMPPIPMGAHVLIVEDIVETGLTLSRLIHELRALYAPASIRCAALLRKPGKWSSAPTSISLHYGFSIADYFAVGYGMDFAGKHRHLDGIYDLAKLEEAR